MTITEFLTARLDERAAELRRLIDGLSSAVGVEFAVSGGSVAWSPQRELAEIEAKRGIVEEYVEAEAYYRTNLAAPAGELAGLGKALRLLAWLNADHADYDERWKP